MEEALVYARRAYEAGVALDDMRLRALRSMEAEPHMYKGDWDAVVEVVEKALPAAWEIREWTAVLFSSAWLAIMNTRLSADAAEVAATKTQPKTAEKRRMMHRAIRDRPHSINRKA